MTKFLDFIGVIGLIAGVVLWIALFRSGMAGWRGVQIAEDLGRKDSKARKE